MLNDTDTIRDEFTRLTRDIISYMDTVNLSITLLGNAIKTNVETQNNINEGLKVALMDFLVMAKNLQTRVDLLELKISKDVDCGHC